MKVSLSYVVHSVHDTEAPIVTEVTEGPHKGRKVTAPVPALLVELVPAKGETGRTITLPVVTHSEEEHAEALVRFGFGASVTVEITAEGKGVTPAKLAEQAAAEHAKEDA